MVNTPQKGQIRSIIFKEGDTWYGVALEFNIVEEGDDPREVMVMLDEAIRGYVESAKQARLGSSVLNQEVDPEYEQMWQNLQQNKAVKSPIQVYNTSITNLSYLKDHAARA